MTLAIAILGLTIGLLNLAWTVYTQGWRDRGRVKLSLSLGITTAPAPGFPEPGRWFFSLDVANSGRRPITIQSAGIAFSKGRTAMFLHSFEPVPKRLEENEKVTFWADEAAFLQNLASDDLGGPTGLVARDAVGTLYRGRLISSIRKRMSRS